MNKGCRYRSHHGQGAMDPAASTVDRLVLTPRGDYQVLSINV